MAKNIMEQLASRARVRVYKPAPGSDDRKSLEGSKLQKGFDPEGNEAHFFVIGADRADYINRAFGKYRVSEPFIPGADDPDAVKLLDKEFICQEEGCGKVFKTAQALQGHKSVHAQRG